MIGRALAAVTISLAAFGPAWGQSALDARWAGTVDDASLKGPGFFSRLVGIVAGGESSSKLGLPFDVEMTAAEYLVLSRESNSLVAVERETGKARVVDLGKAGLVAPVDVAGGREHYYISDSELGAVFVGAGNRLERFLGREQGLDRPTGLALDISRGLLWIVDTGRHQLLGYSLEGELQTVTGFRGAADSAFNYPTFVAVCEDGSIVVNDTMNGKIKKFGADGALIWAAGGFDTSSASLGRAKGVAVDDAGRIFVVDNLEDHVVVLDGDGTYVGHFGGPGNADGELWSPVGIAVCGDTVAVADTQNHRLALFSIAREAKR